MGAALSLSDKNESVSGTEHFSGLRASQVAHVAILGSASVGKTSCMKRFLESQTPWGSAQSGPSIVGRFGEMVTEVEGILMNLVLLDTQVSEPYAILRRITRYP